MAASLSGVQIRAAVATTPMDTCPARASFINVGTASIRWTRPANRCESVGVNLVLTEIHWAWDR